MEAQLKEILEDMFDVDAENIDNTFTPETVELWDSLTHLRMVTAIEERFNVRFAMDEIGQMTSYDAIVRAVNKHLKTNED